jgi:hypothetical protein
MKKCLIFLFLFTGYIHAQKNVQLGHLSISVPNEAVCIYKDGSAGKRFVIENYIVIKNDSLYTYELHYLISGKQELKLKEVVIDAGTLKNIDIALSDSDANKVSEENCGFSFFIYDNLNSADSFTNNRYNEGGKKSSYRHGVFLIFCEDPAWFDKIISAAGKAQ